jgi:HK97 family phage major capsid protein
MVNIPALRQNKAAALEKAEAIHEKAKKEKRDLTPMEYAEFNNLLDEVDKLFNEIRDVQLEQARAGYVSDIGSIFGVHGLSTANLSGAKPGIPANRSYRGMFHSDKLDTLDRGEFKDFGEYLKVLNSGLFDPRLQRSMISGTDTLGGFAIPSEFAAGLLDVSLESEIVRPRATIYPMKSDKLTIPAWDDLDHSSGQVYGGFAINWLDEEESATRQTPKVRKIDLIAKKAGIYVQASREVLEDAPNLEQQLGTALIKGIGWGLDDAFLNGDGVGKPLGILKDPALVTVAKETSPAQAADSIVWLNVLKMIQSLHPSCLTNSVWIASPTLYSGLLSMYIIVGTAGGLATNAVKSAGGQLTLLERPLLFSEKMAAAGDLGDILLVDLSKYAIGLRSDVAIDKSNAPGWLTDDQDFRVILRCDGQGMWNSYFKPKHGANLSWCVTLAERT